MMDDPRLNLQDRTQEQSMRKGLPSCSKSPSTRPPRTDYIERQDCRVNCQGCHWSRPRLLSAWPVLSPQRPMSSSSSSLQGCKPRMRPYYMQVLSPRCFWRHIRTATQNGPGVAHGVLSSACGDDLRARPSWQRMQHCAKGHPYVRLHINIRPDEKLPT
ncbi:hypothetical protein LZ31DRAFT_550117 [Colletotrichum somersetense]|nr:hypothetical protein LZ31DRAFT_550117 [Colletotrichum somersetense]